MTPGRVIRNPATGKVITKNGIPVIVPAGGGAFCFCCGCEALAAATALSIKFSDVEICGPITFCEIQSYSDGVGGGFSSEVGLADIASIPNNVEFTATPDALGVLGTPLALTDESLTVSPGTVLAPAWTGGGMTPYMIDSTLVPSIASPVCGKNVQQATGSPYVIIIVRCANKTMSIEAWMAQCIESEAIHIDKKCAVAIVKIFSGSISTTGTDLVAGITITNQLSFANPCTTSTYTYSPCPYGGTGAAEPVAPVATSGGTALIKSVGSLSNPPLEVHCCDLFTSPCPTCIVSGPGSTCTGTLASTATTNIAALTLCDKEGCAPTCTLGLVDCALQPGSDCTAAEYIGYVDDSDGNHCVKVTITWDGTNWYRKVEDVRCGTTVLMWGGFLIDGTGSAAGTYQQECGSCCGTINCSICQGTVTVSDTGECDPDGCDDNTESSTATTVEPHIREDYGFGGGRAATWFNLGASFAAGNYRISYIGGALKYAGIADMWRVNYDDGNYRVIYNNGSSATNWPNDGGIHGGPGYATIPLAEASQAGNFVDIVHTGGKIGMEFNDSPPDDNCSGCPSPSFSIAALP